MAVALVPCTAAMNTSCVKPSSRWQRGKNSTSTRTPGEATVYVLTGRVRLCAAENAWEGSSGDLLIVPNARHSLEALEASCVLLTVAEAI